MALGPIPVLQVLFIGLKRSGRESNHSPLSSAEVMIGT